ncbi:MAG TPA: hypothetical protein VFY10_02200 [Dehalococcoidia bacterium]|nr:hypothetical protein [Dehalococcoidia bacterium]
MTAEAAAPKTKQTEYIVLLHNDAAGNEGSYSQVGPDKVPAASARAAIQAVARARNLEGTFVAVPARSFAPVKVTVHTETTIRLG